MRSDTKAFGCWLAASLMLVAGCPSMAAGRPNGAGRPVRFQNPDETFLLPEFAETITLFRGARVSGRRTTKRFGSTGGQSRKSASGMAAEPATVRSRGRCWLENSLEDDLQSCAWSGRECSVAT